MAADILVMVGVFGVGVTALFLPVNLLSCGSPHTNTDDTFGVLSNEGFLYVPVPNEITDWMKADMYPTSKYLPRSFAILNDTRILFAGTNGTSLNGNNWESSKLLFKEEGKKECSVVDDSIENPTHFVTTNMNTMAACFLAQQKKTLPMPNNGNGNNLATRNQLFCTNGFSITGFIESKQTGNQYQNPTSVVTGSSGSDIYFKASIENVPTTPKNGYTYHANLHTKTIARLTPSGDNDSAAPTNNTVAAPVPCVDDVLAISLATFFVSSLPILILALIIGFKTKIPSMSVPIFFGTSIIVVNIYVIADPTVPNISLLLKWWCTVFSFLWLVGALFCSVSKRYLKSDALTWCINIGGVVYFGAIHAQLLIPFEDEIWRWICYQFLLVFPLLAYSLVTNKTLLLLLSSFGVLIDVWRISTFIIELTSNVTAQIFTRFVIMASTGVGIVYGGVLYSRNVDFFQKMIDNTCKNTFIKKECCRCSGNKKMETAQVGIELNTSTTETDIEGVGGNFRGDTHSVEEAGVAAVADVVKF